MEKVSNRCRRALESTKHSYAEKNNESIISQNGGSHDFWRIVSSVLSVSKSVIPHLFNGPVVVSSASYKAKHFAELFSKNAYLFRSIGQVISSYFIIS